MYPFEQKVIKNNEILVRIFPSSIDSKDLVWHRDAEDRLVEIKEGVGWMLQMDNCLPEPLLPGKKYFIKAKTWHRVIKGSGNLKVIIYLE